VNQSGKGNHWRARALSRVRQAQKPRLLERPHSLIRAGAVEAQRGLETHACHDNDR
jgi:hypothetical protein